jgi:hypothetical protein
MDSFRNLVVTGSGKHKSGLPTAGSFKQERPLHPMRNIRVEGAVDVVFHRSDTSFMIVTGDNENEARSILTDFDGEQLLIRTATRGGLALDASFGNLRVQIQGASNRVSFGGFSIGQQEAGKASVVIALPSAPALYMAGDGNARCLELDQSKWEVTLAGRGEVECTGRVGELIARTTGAGEMDLSALSAEHARLSVASSGGIAACVTHSLQAVITGSGDINVRGNPRQVQRAVTGTGEVRML